MLECNTINIILLYDAESQYIQLIPSIPSIPIVPLSLVPAILSAPAVVVWIEQMNGMAPRLLPVPRVLPGIAVLPTSPVDFLPVYRASK